MKTGNLNPSTDQSELYKVHKDAASDGDGDAPCFKPLLFPARLPHNRMLNFLGRPEIWRHVFYPICRFASAKFHGITSQKSVIALLNYTQYLILFMLFYLPWLYYM
jgi:hypothetical protein